MKTKPLALFMVSAVVAGTLANPPAARASLPVVLTDRGGTAEYLLAVPKGGDTQSYRKGQPQMQAYVLVPQAARLGVQRTWDGQALHFTIAPLDSLIPAAASSGRDLPAGISSYNASYLIEQTELMVTAKFKEFVDSVLRADAEAEFYYTDARARPARERTVALAKFNIDELPVLAKSALSDRKPMRIGFIRKNGAFTEDDALSFQNALALVIRDVTLRFKPVTFPLVYPDTRSWMERMPSGAIPFYAAYDLLDDQLIPALARSGALKAISDAVPESIYRRDLLDDGLRNYFEGGDDVLQTYQVRLRGTPQTTSVARTYYLPDKGSLTIPLLVTR